MKSAMKTTAVVLAALVARSIGQDGILCEYYSSGRAICNGVHLNVAAVLCGDEFDKKLCVAESSSTTRFYFKVSTSVTPSPLAILQFTVLAFLYVECACDPMHLPTNTCLLRMHTYLIEQQTLRPQGVACIYLRARQCFPLVNLECAFAHIC